MSLRPSDTDALDTFELELRKLGGVVGVGFSGTDEDLVVHISVPATVDADRVRTEALELVQLYFDRPVTLTIGRGEEPLDGLSAPAEPTIRIVDEPVARLHPFPEPAAAPTQPVTAPTQPVTAPTEPVAAPTQPATAPTGRGRAQLLGVHRGAGGTEIEVHLAYHATRVVGRAPVGQAAAVVQATVDALERLGWSVPFTVRSAVRLAFGVDGAVAVVLQGAGAERLGLSRAVTPEEATAKATLQALNRYLDDPRLPLRPR